MPDFSNMFDLSKLTGPLSLIIFALLVDAGTRLLFPALRDYIRPLFGLPYKIWQWLQQKLARTNRTSRDLEGRATLAMIVMIIMTGVIAFSLNKISSYHPYAVYALWFFVWQWSVMWTVSRDVLRLDKPNAKQLMAICTRRNIQLPLNVSDTTDAAGIYRVTVMALAASLVQGLATPLFYALVARLCDWPAFYGAAVGVMASVVLGFAALDSTQKIFQRNMWMLAQLIAFIPSRIVGIIVILATIFTPKANSFKAMRLVVTQGHLYPDISLGWVMAAFSGAFGVALPLEKAEWLGDDKATARIEKGTLQRAVWLHAVTVMLVVLILSALLLLSM